MAKNWIDVESWSRGSNGKVVSISLKYLDYKKDVDPNVHVRVFNAIVRTNRETF
jgi:hypothetical protein